MCWACDEEAARAKAKTILYYRPFSTTDHSVLLGLLTLWIPEISLPVAPQWGAADAEIKVPSGENTQFKRSPFKAWSRSV